MARSISAPQLLFSSIVSAQATLKSCAQQVPRSFASSPLAKPIVALHDLKQEPGSSELRQNSTHEQNSLPTPGSHSSRPSSNQGDHNSGRKRSLGSSDEGTPMKSVSESASSTTTSKPVTSAPSSTVSARLMDLGKRLLEAARLGQTETVRQLVVNSGAPFTSDWLGTTALHQAAQHGHPEIAEILLRGGVNRDARTKIERTALHLAAQSGSLEVVDLLVNHGSDVNARDMLKMTPLHWAIERGHTCIVERLLLSGADVNARSKFQLTPLDMAEKSENLEIIDLLGVSKGA